MLRGFLFVETGDVRSVAIHTGCLNSGRTTAGRDKSVGQGSESSIDACRDS